MLLSKAVVEKDVENAYRGEIQSLLKTASIESPFQCDGHLTFYEGEACKLDVLMEFKFLENLKDKLTRINILIQALYYLKKFELSGYKLPVIVLVGDKNECFLVHVNDLLKYLSWGLDWTLPPSVAHKHNEDLLRAMLDDKDLSTFVYDVDDKFDMRQVIGKMLEMSSGEVRKIRITKHNLTQAFTMFDERILKDKKMPINDRANLFIQILINSGDNYRHPSRKNTLVTKGFGDLQVNGDQFGSFFKHFEGVEYSPREKEELTALADRLIDDVTRRRKGEFFTPTIWVDEAHKMLSESFGEDWKERFVVWDCAAGTLNLTRDYRFKELYCSTINAADLETARQAGYNPEATLFQFDFLNDPIEKVPEGLQKAIAEGREILFLINPPYGRASGETGRMAGIGSGVTETECSIRMKEYGWGACSAQLYAQFLYRIRNLSRENVYIGVYAKSLYKTGPSYNAFREKFYATFEYVDGMLFNAAHFDGTSDAWGVDFSIWKPGMERRDILPLTVKDATFDGIIDLGTIGIYNMDSNKSLAEWLEKDDGETVIVPKLTSALKVKDADRDRPILKDSIGVLVSKGNNVYYNSENVILMSSAYSDNGTYERSITPLNYEKAIAAFSARKLIKGNWINDKDEYLAPDEAHPEFKQFTLDSIVYSLFNNSSQQSSLRGIEYKGKKWDIKNEFFWLPRNMMLELANEAGFSEMYSDAKTDDDRFVYKKLCGDTYDLLSPDARHVLDLATELVKKSMMMRSILHDEHPEYHLSAWDAGYAQLKILWKEYFPKEYKEFREAYARLEERMRPLVYKLGFLKE